MKHLIHQGHPGVDKCKLRARQSVYWPGISHEITQFVLHCPTCITHCNRQQQEALLEHDVPEARWIKVAADLFTIYGKDYLLVVDYSSKYFEVSHAREPVESPAVVNSIKIFSRHGIPKELFTDGGPHFVAKKFKKFTKDWDFIHDSSSPHFPQSNGIVECTVQIIKNTLKKAHEANEDVYLALLALNSTPPQDGRYISSVQGIYSSNKENSSIC